MDPIIDSDWLECKNELVDDTQHVGNIARSWQCRELGINPTQSPPNKTVLENIAEDILVQKPLKIRCCDLPGYPRSTFLMVFSPDGTKVASTHGNHNVYVSELASGKHVRILKGHPRTPWCIAFHPSHPQLIGSGCLGGQVRVWDLSGGSEVWTVGNETVIASIAFHPRDQLLVIATFNELYFWDWNQPAPFTKVCTNNINEKVRYVAFDSLGYKLITGISVFSTSPGSTSLLQAVSHGPNNNQPLYTRRNSPRETPPNNNNNNNNSRPPENTNRQQEMIVYSYQNLVQRYDSLVRNYRRLFMARHQLSNTPPANTTDRGTDPMETDTSVNTASDSNWAPQSLRSTTSRETSENDTSRSLDANDSGDGDGGSRLLNLDVLSIDSNPSRSHNPNRIITSAGPPRSIFGSRSSAFQRLNDNQERTRTTNANGQTRWLPNPFSSSANNSSRSDTVNFSNNTQQSSDNNAGSSRTSVFTSHRTDSPSARYFLQRRRHYSLSNSHGLQRSAASTNLSQSSHDRHSERPPSSRASASPRPSMTNSSTQLSPGAAQTINESLDLIRDILRDSGTRLLNLITNMSLSTLASVERRRHFTSISHSDDNESTDRPRQRPRERLFSSSLRREFISSESDSDSDQSLEVNLFTRRNTQFSDQAPNEGSSNNTNNNQPTDRMEIDLNMNDEELAQNTRDNESPRRFNVTVTTKGRFRVRSYSTEESRSLRAENRREANGDEEVSPNGPSSYDINRPSTSRDNRWMNDPLSLSSSGTSIPPDEAFRKVKSGVHALLEHTTLLTDMWLRGARMSMRELRAMWENLRRQVLALHRQTGRQDVPNYYTRSLIERCRFLSGMLRQRNSPSTPPRNTRNTRPRDQSVDRNNDDSQQTQMSTDSTSSSIPTENEQSTSAGPSNASRTRLMRRQYLLWHKLSYPITNRRRLLNSCRWRHEDEFNRRSRNINNTRWGGRGSWTNRRDNTRSLELYCTRNEIRMRAMQVLSLMFNMMMSCLEERRLSQLIMYMLRTLKKALAMTCLILMTNRLNRRENGNSPQTRNTEPSNTNRQENTPETPQQQEETQTASNREENTDTNTDVPESSGTQRNEERNNDSNSTSSWPTSDSEEERRKSAKKMKKSTNEKVTKSSKSKSNDRNAVPGNSNRHSPTQRWSNRLAVQIAAANRNTSATARSRREQYMESRRQKALFRTNPNANPISRRRILPPSASNRIPTIRYVPAKRQHNNRVPPTNGTEDPVAGPSDSQPGPSRESGARDPSSSRSDTIHEFENRIHLFRIAHMRLRTAARTRLRRLQTIRLYTPSSVREMFAIQSNSENEPGNQSSLNNSPDVSNRRPFATYRPHILTTRNDLSNREGLRQFDSILNNVAVPLVQVNNNETNQPNPPQGRLPRVHEYLQPIILAQNALVVEDGVGGGGGNGGGGIGGHLLDAGFISEAWPAPIHRVQAWDFTTGDTPDIADSTKNVVVQRCRIHNDASIDISKDGRLLVALLPVPRFRNANQWLGVYSLEWGRLGQCLHTAVLEQSAVSVALSPTARHLAVGLGSRRFTTLPHARNNVFALLYRLSPLESSSRTGLSPIRELEQNFEQGFTSLNCLRWAPQPGQGLVYANNTGQLIIMS